MEIHSAWLRFGVAAACVASLAGCSHSGIVLDCEAARPAVRDIIAIHAGAGTAEDLTLIPTLKGRLEATNADYTIHFHKFSAGRELRFRISRSTNAGTRQVIDPASGQVVANSADAIVCKPYGSRKDDRSLTRLVAAAIRPWVLLQ